MQSTTNLVARLLFVALFLPAGISKLTGFDGTVGYFNSLGIPAAALAVSVTIAIEILGSLAVLVGFKTRAAAIVLAVFTLAASIAGHAYWAVPAEQVFVQKLLFFKNMAVVGGLLLLAIQGAGKLSIDGKTENA
ncbi:DoxX family protein [beta proteobacterium MWH-UniP1]